LKTIVKNLLLSLIGLSLMLTYTPVVASQSMDEQTVLAALALNIVRFTTWPSEIQTQMPTINFCVVGDNVTQQSFSSIDNKPVGDKTLRIIFLSRLRNYDECHVLYISELKENFLLQVFAETKQRPLLTIGESYEFAVQGGMIGLENVDGKINMNVNLAVVHGSKLNISSRLLKLAKIIGDKG
jgi:YfiR/HmsC-like